MKRAEHEAETVRLLGAAFPQVHEWLDAFAMKDGKFNPYHRKHRHHRTGIEQVRALWGDAAAQAAEVHIRQDFRHGGVPDAVAIPEDEADFVKRGFI